MINKYFSPSPLKLAIISLIKILLFIIKLYFIKNLIPARFLDLIENLLLPTCYLESTNNSNITNIIQENETISTNNQKLTVLNLERLNNNLPESFSDLEVVRHMLQTKPIEESTRLLAQYEGELDVRTITYDYLYS
jgi:hypothetical protein